MVSFSLLASALLALASTGVYALVGRLMLERELKEPQARFAMRMFAGWWVGLATITLLAGTRDFLAALGIVNLAVHVSLALVAILPLSGALFGLTYYLLFIYFGKPSLAVPLATFHVGLFVALTYLVVASEPNAVTANTWGTSIAYAQTPNATAVGVATAAILGPVLFSAVAFATLFFRTTEPTTRYRVAVVAGAFIGWFGISLLATLAGWSDLEMWPLISRASGLVATTLILLAYRPPPWVQTRLGVAPLAHAERRKDNPTRALRPRTGPRVRHDQG